MAIGLMLFLEGSILPLCAGELPHNAGHWEGGWGGGMFLRSWDGVELGLDYTHSFAKRQPRHYVIDSAAEYPNSLPLCILLALYLTAIQSHSFELHWPSLHLSLFQVSLVVCHLKSISPYISYLPLKYPAYRVPPSLHSALC
jgi:hypothetical protein